MSGMTRERDGYPIETVGQDAPLSVIPAVGGGDPSEMKSRWLPVILT